MSVEITNWRITPRLRWREQEPIALELGVGPSLEQAWECVETGEVRWELIDLVHHDGSPWKDNG